MKKRKRRWYKRIPEIVSEWIDHKYFDESEWHSTLSEENMDLRRQVEELELDLDYYKDAFQHERWR